MEKTILDESIEKLKSDFCLGEFLKKRASQMHTDEFINDEAHAILIRTYFDLWENSPLYRYFRTKDFTSVSLMARFFLLVFYERFFGRKDIQVF